MQVIRGRFDNLPGVYRTVGWSIVEDKAEQVVLIAGAYADDVFSAMCEVENMLDMEQRYDTVTGKHLGLVVLT